MIPLLVIRHGTTDWNAAGLIQGRTDRPLDETGRAATGAARVPLGWAGATCLASPLMRAMETARLLRLDPTPEPRLVEMAWGEWEGRRLKALRSELGEAMAANEARGLDFRPPGGESPRDVQERLKPLLASLSGPTVFVTHKGVLRALYALATGWRMTEKAPDKLRDGTAHAFRVSADGAPEVETLNIPLERAP
jgi:2,3-bisphosphoglycerate-dependent phosphoglycerate mutase